MTIPLRRALQWQDSTDLDAFITRLTDSEDRVRQNLRTFVVGEKVRAQLDHLFGELGRRLADNRDMGRYIYGSFGSGKSHLLTVLGKMLERDEEVYTLGHEALRALRTAHPWLTERKTLVVRINMMGKRSLTHAVYEGFNEALPRALPRVSFTDEERVFRLMNLDAERLGGMGALVERMAVEGALGLPAGSSALRVRFIEDMRAGVLDQRLQLAAAFLNWRNKGAGEVRPADLWLDAHQGLDRIARHAKGHGYTGVAWLIDELVIWIRGKSRAEYIEQLNHLSAMVDHDAARVLPFFVAVAIQQDISRTCPDDLSQSDFQAQFGFIKDRFDPRIQLEDQDLYEVAAERVLARNPALSAAERAAFEGAIGQLFTQHGEAISALSGELNLDFVRRLYPFHPALLRILVDATQALSRNRTAVAALYVLLNRYGDLLPGKFIPVGALWDFIFTAENVASMRQNTASPYSQRIADAFATMERLEGKVDDIARQNDFNPASLRALVRTVLLCQLSERPYFPNGQALRERITPSMLLRLNQTEVVVVHERTGISRVVGLFRKLNGVALEVQVNGAEADALLHIKTEQVNIEAVLTAARAQTGFSERFAYMRRLLNEQLALGLKDGNEATVEVLWKGTRRKGKVRLANVRTLSYAGQSNDFDPQSHDFLLLVDYPFDEEAGRSQQDDVEAVERARARAPQWTLAWLPAHLNESERNALHNAAAVELIKKDERRYFESIPPREADSTRRALESFQASRKGELVDAVRRLYFEASARVEVLKGALGNVAIGGVDRSRAVEALGSHILDRRYPSHPDFRRKVSITDLGQVAEWVIRAAKTGRPVDLRAAEMSLIDAIAVPLELVHKGAGSITPRIDGRYLAPIRAWIGDRRSFEASELREALMAEGETGRPREAQSWGFGFSKEVANFWLLYLLQAEGFEAQVGDRSATVSGLGDLSDRFRLVKDEVVDHPTWDRARKAAERLFGLQGRSDLPNSPEQAKLFREVGAKATELAQAVDRFGKALEAVNHWAGVEPALCKRLAEARELHSFLLALTAETANAARVRRLAAAAQGSAPGAAPLDRFVSIRSHLADETAALNSLDPYRIAFGHVNRVGSESDRTAVVTRLQKVLGDAWGTSLLQDAVPPWILEAEQRFKALLREAPDEEADRRRADEERARREAEEQAARERDEAERRTREAEAARALAERRAQEAERQAREADEARRRREEQAARETALAQEALRRAEEAAARQAAEAEETRQRLVQEEARRRAMERTCEGRREEIGAAAERELAAAIGASRGARVRVRIIVETIE